MDGKVTPKQVAEKLGVKPGTVRSWIAKRVLVAEKVGGRYWVLLADAEALRVVVGK